MVRGSQNRKVFINLGIGLYSSPVESSLFAFFQIFKQWRLKKKKMFFEILSLNLVKIGWMHNKKGC